MTDQSLVRVFPLVRVAHLALALFTILLTPGCAQLPQPTAAERAALAPTGALRVGVYPGSPTSLVRDAATGQPKGITHDVGWALAEHLGVRFELVEFRALPEVLAAVKAGTVDFTGTNAAPARAADMDFTRTVIDIELGYLVVPKLLPNATIVPTPTVKAGGEMLAARTIDAYATNKVILYEQAANVRDARVLDGQWGVEHWAFAVPKGRDGALRYLERYLEQAEASGVVQRAVERSGLRGAVRPAH